MKNLLFIAILITTIMFSCRKAEVDSDTQSSQDNAIAESAFNRSFTTVSGIFITEEGVKKTNNLTCATISLLNGDTTDFPTNGSVTYNLNFGDGCTDANDGRFRQGKLVATFSGARWNQPGAKVAIVLDEYIEDGISYEGTLTATCNGNFSFTTSVDNGKCIGKDWDVSYEGNKTMEWKEGQDTPEDATDDVFEFSGNSSGIDRNGVKFTTEVTKPIDKHSACKWIRSGTVELTPEGRATRIIDFGDGGCDADATISINGNTFPFTMK